VKPIVRFIDLLLYTSLYAAFCATGLCMATERLINGYSPPMMNSLHILVFGSTLLVYNTPRIARMLNGGLKAKQGYAKWYVFFFCVGVVITGLGLYGQSAAMLTVSCILGIFAFGYFLPLLPFKNKKRLRDFGYLKIIVLTGVWTTATSVLPMLYWQKNLAAYPLEILLRFVFVFALCVMFDLRDMRHDLENKIYTLPNKVGIVNSYRLIYAALIFFAAISVVQYIRYPIAGRLAGALITAAGTWLIVQYVKKHSSDDRLYLLLVDGAMLMYALLVLSLN
jgi:4-hydroxybenzoate polyprenyltransferase